MKVGILPLLIKELQTTQDEDFPTLSHTLRAIENICQCGKFL